MKVESKLYLSSISISNCRGWLLVLTGISHLGFVCFGFPYSVMAPIPGGVTAVLIGPTDSSIHCDGHRFLIEYVCTPFINEYPHFGVEWKETQGPRLNICGNR